MNNIEIDSILKSIQFTLITILIIITFYGWFGKYRSDKMNVKLDLLMKHHNIEMVDSTKTEEL